MSAQREKSIFLSAIEKHDGHERQQYIMQACGNDAQLLESVEALLFAHQKVSSTLDYETDALDDDESWPLKLVENAIELGASDFSPLAKKAFDRSGETIGPFRLMEKLGEGGFGEVYVAKQRKPVQRNVAMKLLKPGMDSREVLARFEAEQQALALMTHPNIAQVFDAGTTEQGQPYIVMELIHGVEMTTFCRRKKLSLIQRLELFIDVCQAVHHAHQKGVIHRDIKPSNVLVTLHDTVAVVKVIDFGVAKALNVPLTDKTIYTRFAQLIGTPMYMSPEQAEMNALDVDTRSDIYSLGVLLYELLTMHTPFEQDRMQSASFDEMRRMIREETPPRPSARLSTKPSFQTTDESPIDQNPLELARRLRGDLDWVVMKALEKDRRRRYETASDFARDIRRYLEGQTVVARPPSSLYRFKKFASRNKIALTAILLIFVILLTSSAESTWQAIRATRAQAETERLRKDAVAFAERLKQANILLVRARANADQHRWPLAFEEYTQATNLSPNHFLTWAGRGSMLAKLGAWKHAAADYAKAIELGTPASDPSWWGVAQLSYFAGEDQAYAAMIQALEKRIDEDDLAQLTIVARSICLKPIAKEQAKKLLTRLETLEKQRPNFGRPRFPPPRISQAPFEPDFSLLFDDSGQKSQRNRTDKAPQPPQQGPPPRGGKRGGFGSRFGFPREVVIYSKALVCYRNKDFQQARAILDSVPTDALSGPMMMIHTLSCMVDFQLGNKDHAREQLSTAQKQFDQWLHSVLEQTDSIPWFDGIETSILLREAHQLILDSPLPPNPTIAKIEEHAHQLVQP